MDIEKIRRAQILEIFIVNADAETGEWIGDPQSTGDTTTAWDWAQRKDTDADHFDTYVYDADTQAERALIVRWVA